jgi:hypothetical protein
VGCDAQDIAKVVNYTVSADELEPIQTLYKYYENYWRPISFFGDYPVDISSYTKIGPISPDKRNIHRSDIINQVPVSKDPIKNTENITGTYSRCRYDFICPGQADAVSWWNTASEYNNELAQICLGHESPCFSSTLCNDSLKNGLACTEEEENIDCSGFVYDWSTLIEDLKEGYTDTLSGVGIPPSDSQPSYNNCCYPVSFGDCNIVQYPPLCECDSFWMTKYRRRKLLDNSRYRWAADIECYNSSNFLEKSNAFVKNKNETIQHDRNYEQTYDSILGPELLQRAGSYFASEVSEYPFRLSSQWLFNVTQERFWKIAQSDSTGFSQVFWNDPGTSGDKPNPTYTTPPNPDPYPYQVDNMVPKWWIFACSSVPFFQFDLEDAVDPMNSLSSNPRTPAITNEDYEDLIDKRTTSELYSEWSLQSVFEKLGNAGYFHVKDWRAEQLKAYKELNERFPDMGYETYANKTIDDMPLLGPVRKRYYERDYNVAKSYNIRKPYLRPDLVPNSSLLLQAECFLPFSGQWENSKMSEEVRQKVIDDYYFWAERQWVYFRAQPLGWTWASWDAMLTCPCNASCIGGSTAPNEEAAILAGCGRAKGNCIESWFNAPQISCLENNPTNNFCINTSGGPPSTNPCPACGEFSEGTWNGNACTCCLSCCDASTSNPDSCDDDCRNVCEIQIPVPQCNLKEGCSYNSVAKGPEPDFDPEAEGTETEQNFENCGCAPSIVAGCPLSDCQKLSIMTDCRGVHIIATQYATENKIDPEKPSFYRCLWTANTFLTPARNLFTYDENYKCVGSSNTSMFSFWNTVKNTHRIPLKSICNPHFAAITGKGSPNDEQYLVVPACESGTCWPWYDTVTNEGCDAVSFGAPVNCLFRMSCVPLAHGKEWTERYACPPSCGTDYPTYGYNNSYWGKDGDTGSSTESSCERDEFLGYSPECKAIKVIP